MAYDFTWTIGQLRLTKYLDDESVFSWLVHSWPINIYDFYWMNTKNKMYNDIY